MDYKKTSLVICLIICIFLCISTVNANENLTSDSVSDTVISENVTQVQIGDNVDDNADDIVSQPQDDDVLGASTVYFDASASSDGDGSKSNPYKYLKDARIPSGCTAYFAKGTYTLSESCRILSSSTGKVTFIGQGSNTIIKSKLTNDFAFIINSNSNFVLKDLTLDNVHINNHANLQATNVVFRNSVGFSNKGPKLDYLDKDVYDSTFGGVIICDTPPNKVTSVSLTDCNFKNNNAKNGGVILAHNSQVNINNCIFEDSSATKFGGIIYGNNSEITIQRSSFTNSNAKYGGAFYSYKGNLKIYDSNFYNSKANSFGGAIAIDSLYSLIDNCTFNNYESESDAGGAIYTKNSSFDVYYSSFSKGKSYFGGAICNLKTNLTLVGTEFIDNSATYYGGSLFNMYGVIDIRNNNFINTHAGGSGGAIFNRISDVLNLETNIFINSTAIYGHAVFVDGNNNTVFENQDTFRDLYNLICVYRGTLNGKEQTVYSNYLTFSVSNDGYFITPLIDETTQPTSYNSYAKFSISVVGKSSSVIYTNLDQDNKLVFSLDKYGNSFSNENLEMYIIDEAGDIICSGSLALSGNKNYVNANITNLNFKDLLLCLQYGNIYDIKSYSSVPLFNYTVSSTGSLPSSYDSRDYGYITPVKNQLEGGNCWAFAGIATLEACLKKATGITYDFSEENVKNLMEAYSLFGWDSESNDGGSVYKFIGYLNSWFGPVYDEYDLYDDYSSLSVIYDPVFHIQNVYILPQRQDSYDNDLIKRAIMDYGAVSISTPWEDGRHAITLVGWDDEYTGYDVFNRRSSGAWIFKNSWGPNWENNGFSYLYYKQEFNNAYTFIFNDDRGYSDIYQYDYAGVTGYKNTGLNKVYYYNIFTSRSNDILSAASTFFYSPANYTMDVYLNNKLVTSQSGSCQAGYYTIPLKKEIQLSTGDKFKIQFTVSSSTSIKVPLCLEVNTNRVTSESGVSFYSSYGSYFSDLYPSVACIKAFTRSSNVKQIELNVNHFSYVKANEKISITATLPEYYVQDGLCYYLDGFVTFTINNQYYYAQVKNGKAYLNMTFDKEGVYALTAQYRTNLAISNKVMFNFNVGNNEPDNVVIKASDVSKYYGGTEKYVVTVTNNGAPVTGAYVKVSIPNTQISYTLITNSNGQASYNFDLNPDNYIVTATYNGKSVSSKYVVKSTIGVSDSSQNYLSGLLHAEFLDKTGKSLSNTQVTFKVGSNQFKAVTSSLGYADVNITLTPGSYVVTVINPNTGEEKKVNLEISKASSNCLLVVNKNGNGVIITASVTPSSASGYVNFIFDGNEYKVKIENGKAQKTINSLSTGTYYVSAYYSGDENFVGSSAYKSFTFTNNKYVLKTYDYSTYYGVSKMVAYVLDENGKGVSGQAVKFTLGDKTETVVTNNLGEAKFNSSGLSAGNYNFVIEYGAQSNLANLEVLSTISLLDYTAEYSKVTINAKFVDQNGVGIKNEYGIIYLGSFYSSRRTDENGFVTWTPNIKAGHYTLTLKNSITGENKQMDFVIAKTNPTISLTKSQTGNSVTLTASLSSTAATGNVIFNVGDKKYTVSVNNGKAVLTLNNFEEGGTYIATAKYSGDNNFNDVLSSSVSFDIAAPKISIYAPDFTKYYKSDERFSVVVRDNGNPVSSAVVKLNFEGTIYSLTTDKNGVASIGVNLHPGSYVFNCTYGGKSVTSKITIKSTVQTSEINGEYLNTKVYATFLNTNGSAISNHIVGFTIGNNEYSTLTDSYGFASVKVNLKPGTYVATTKNPITGEEKEFTLTIAKITPTLTMQLVEKNGKDAIRVSLSPASATGKITFIDGSYKENQEISNGVAYYIMYQSGTYNVKVKYSGDSCFNEVSDSIQVVATYHPPNLVYKSLTKYYGDSKQLTIRALDNDGNPIVGLLLDLSVYDSYGDIYEFDYGETNSKGYVKLNCNYYPDTYYIDIEDDESYLGTVKVVVKKPTPKITASSKTYKVKSTKKYTITLKANNKVLKNKKVYIKVGGKTYSAKTNSKGKATFNLAKLNKRGTFTAKIQFKHSYYKTVNKYVKIYVRW